MLRNGDIILTYFQIYRRLDYLQFENICTAIKQLSLVFHYGGTWWLSGSASAS
jgi:hypothetical protein